MPVRDLIGWLVKRNPQESRVYFEPDPVALDIVIRQDRLEEKLRQREQRRDLIRAQVRAMKGNPA